MVKQAQHNILLRENVMLYKRSDTDIYYVRFKINDKWIRKCAKSNDVATATETALTDNLIDIITETIEIGNTYNLPSEELPDFTALGIAQANRDGRNAILTDRAIIVHRAAESINGPIPITMQTAGNRSMLGNDFTQINDLGYGLVTINGGISEMVSMFTYYCHGAYYAGNGGQIRSTTGSNCNGVYGLIAEGSDPNEVPDAVLLENDMVQSSKSFSAEIVLELTDNLTVSANDIIANSASNPTGYGRSVFSSSGKKVYLYDVEGTFSQGNSLFTGITFTDYTDPQTGTGGTDTTIDIDVVDATGYINLAEQLSMYIYDTEFPPTGRGELTFLHTNKLARYELASVQKADGILVDGYTIDSTEYTYGATTRDTITINVGEPDETTIVEPSVNPTTEATIVITKSAINGGTYKAAVFDDKGGNNYKVGDIFTVLGEELGASGEPDPSLYNAVVTVEAVSRTAINIQNGVFTGIITKLSVSGTPLIVNGYTPQRDGQVYKLNFSTSSITFSKIAPASTQIVLVSLSIS